MQIGREPININYNDEYYEAFKLMQEAYTKNKDTHKDSKSFSSGSTVAVQMEDGGPWMCDVIVKGNSEDYCC